MAERVRPWDVVERAVREGLPGLRLLPGFTGAELADLEARVDAPLPEEVRELLEHCGGLDLEAFDGELAFAGWWFVLEEVFPLSFGVGGDRCGNFWVVDVDVRTGAWGKVFFACHDPSGVVIQADDLAQFLSQVLDEARPGRRRTLDRLATDAAYEVYAHDPFLVGRAEALSSGDPVLSAFATTLPEAYRIADLRAAGAGAGFSLRLDFEGELRRQGAALLFGVPPRRPSLLARLIARVHRR